MFLPNTTGDVEHPTEMGKREDGRDLIEVKNSNLLVQQKAFHR